MCKNEHRLNGGKNNPNGLNYLMKNGVWYYSALDKQEIKLDNEFKKSNRLGNINRDDFIDLLINNNIKITSEIMDDYGIGFFIKECTICNNELPMTDFHNDSSTTDGKYGICKSCRYKITKTKENENPIYKLSRILRSRTNTAFKKNGYKKTSKTQQLLGCDFKTAFNHIEKQFYGGMSWKNQGEWHIDHIIPVSSATTKDELIKLFHYTNIQPLWAKDNYFKNNTIPLVSQF